VDTANAYEKKAYDKATKSYQAALNFAEKGKNLVFI
jgi:hypothetical protein